MPDTPQFATAEYSQPSNTPFCQLCNTPLATEYYRMRGKMACAACATQLLSGASASGGSALLPAALLGALAALIGLVAYTGFTIATGYYVGYLALGVGYLVAKAILLGSRGVGGRPYQIAAVLLTYVSIALAEIPIGLWQFRDKYPLPQLISGGLRLIPTGLASPFLELKDPLHGLLGAVILIVGLRVAWRMTAAARVPVDGPFSLTTAAG